ncbi:MAG TPA: response regulator [Terriglobales bacterium]|nr:response regulator [Terriglobales bacterium]
MKEKHSILVVDDEKNIADTVAWILQAAGYIARPVYDGSSALAITREQTPDLIISDVLMPGINGIELAINASIACPRCRILLFSGQAGSADMLDEARRQGHEFELLAKPIEPEDLVKKVADVLASAQQDDTSARAT